MTQLKDGLVLLVLGMGTVFVFLVLLILATKIMSRICMKLDKSNSSGTKASPAPTVQAKSVAAAPVTDDAAIAAAIAAAYDKSRV